jgi:hypothetical protein
MEKCQKCKTGLEETNEACLCDESLCVRCCQCDESCGCECIDKQAV